MMREMLRYSTNLTAEVVGLARGQARRRRAGRPRRLGGRR